MELHLIRCSRSLPAAVAWIAITANCGVAASPASAQVAASQVAGVVQDPDGNPLALVDVVVQGTEWRTETGDSGRWALTLPAGEWRLSFLRVGYRPSVWAGSVSEALRTSIIIVLEPEPVRLRGLSVKAEGAPALARTVTKSTVRHAPPLGEADVFRAVALLPGVTQPNDLKGRLHLAGGASDETGVTLDGHVLQDPFHLLGLMGAFNTAALGRANVLVHHVPTSVAGRAAGFIALSTREFTAEPATEAVASLLSVGATTWQPDGPLGLEVLASGRVTYLGSLLEAAGVDDVPWYGYHDAVVRLGRTGDRWRTELVAFTTRDRIRDPELERRNDGTDYEPLHWGEHLIGATVERRSPGWGFTGRLSFNRAFTGVDNRPVRQTRIDSERDWAAASVEVQRRSRSWSSLAGVGADLRRNDQTWEARGLIDELLAPNTPAFYSGRHDLLTVSPYGEATVRLGDGWVAAGGARLWIHNSGFHPAPRFRLSRLFSETAAIHLSVERRFQFDAQSEEPLEGNVSPPLFLLDQPRRVDAAAVIAEWDDLRMPWDGRGGFRADVFARRYPDRPVLPERAAGATREDIAAEFPNFRRIESRAYGASLSGRMEWRDAWVLEASYAYQRVREEYAAGEWSPTAWDAPHSFTGFVSAPGPWGIQTTAVLQLRSGAAVSPIETYTLAPWDRDAYSLQPRYIRGARNSLRLPSYRRLDLGFRRSWRSSAADWTVFFQVLNLFWSDNPIGYDWAQYFGKLGSTSEEPPPGRSGLPVLPSFGVEVAW